jgi:hypothetical protein
MSLPGFILAPIGGLSGCANRLNGTIAWEREAQHHEQRFRAAVAQLR